MDLKLFIHDIVEPDVEWVARWGAKLKQSYDGYVLKDAREQWAMIEVVMTIDQLIQCSR